MAPAAWTSLYWSMSSGGLSQFLWAPCARSWSPHSKWSKGERTTSIWYNASDLHGLWFTGLLCALASAHSAIFSSQHSSHTHTPHLNFSPTALHSRDNEWLSGLRISLTFSLALGSSFAWNILLFSTMLSHPIPNLLGLKRLPDLQVSV